MQTGEEEWSGMVDKWSKCAIEEMKKQVDKVKNEVPKKFTFQNNQLTKEEKFLVVVKYYLIHGTLNWNFSAVLQSVETFPLLLLKVTVILQKKRRVEELTITTLELRERHKLLENLKSLCKKFFQIFYHFAGR